VKNRSGARWRRGLPLAVLLGAATLSGCASRPAPLLEPLQAKRPKTPLVLIPGLGGSRLRDVESGKVVWGRSHRLFFPRNGSYELVRPIAEDAEWQDPLQAHAVVDRLKLLGLVPIDVYASLLRALEENGYRRGDLSDPRPDDTLFVFPYDMRYDTVVAARDLLAKLENVRKVRGDPVLRVDLLGHSNGVLIARYLVKYGAAALADAESGRARPPAGIRVEKLILAGPLNSGAPSTIEDLNRGRRYLPLVGRRVRPEVIFTFRSVWASLPTRGDGLFVDAERQPLDVDPFDAETWRRYGWSVYRPKVERRTAERPDLFGDSAQRAEYLSVMLDDARRLHALLAADVAGFDETRYYLIRSDDAPGHERVVLIPKKDGWKTRIEKLPGDARPPEDGEAGLSPQERRAITDRFEAIPARHRFLLRKPEAIHTILRFLAE
jgi:hypothetical protein